MEKVMLSFNDCDKKVLLTRDKLHVLLWFMYVLPHSGNKLLLLSIEAVLLTGTGQRRLDKVMRTKYQIVELARESLPIDLLGWIEAIPSLILMFAREQS